MNLRKIGFYKDIYLSIFIPYNIYLSKIGTLSLYVVSIVVIREGVLVSPLKWRHFLQEEILLT